MWEHPSLSLRIAPTNQMKTTTITGGDEIDAVGTQTHTVYISAPWRDIILK
jgi:hypothetical protein